MSQKGIKQRPYTMKANNQKRTRAAVFESVLMGSADYSLDALTAEREEGNEEIGNVYSSDGTVPFSFATSLRSECIPKKNNAGSSSAAASHTKQQTLLQACSGGYCLPATNAYLIEPNAVVKPINECELKIQPSMPSVLPSWRDSPNLEHKESNAMAVLPEGYDGVGRNREPTFEDTILPKPEEQELLLNREPFVSSLPSSMALSGGADVDLLPRTGSSSQSMKAAYETKKVKIKHELASADGEPFKVHPQKRQRMYQRRNSVVIIKK